MPPSDAEEETVMAETPQDTAETLEDLPDDFWPQEQQVLVRMYGQGIGDCLL